MLLQTGMSLYNIIHLDQSTKIIANSKSVIETVQKSNETFFHSVHFKVFDKVTWSGCKDGSVRILAISTRARNFSNTPARKSKLCYILQPIYR